MRYRLLLEMLYFFIFFNDDLVRSMVFRKVSAKLDLINLSVVVFGRVDLVAVILSYLQFLFKKFSEACSLPSFSLCIFFFTNYLFFWVFFLQLSAFLSLSVFSGLIFLCFIKNTDSYCSDDDGSFSLDRYKS